MRSESTVAMYRNPTTIKFILIVVWLIFTLSLTCWWYIFSQEQISTLISLHQSSTEELVSNQKMLKWEGAVLLACIGGGGLALAIAVIRESRMTNRIRQFFMTFSHELKNPIASLRIQAEALKEDLPNSEHAEMADRILADTVRLNARLENSLTLASLDTYQIFPQTIPLDDIIRSASRDWPELEVSLKAPGVLFVDRRAIESVIQNLMQNSVTHGEATRMEVTARPDDAKEMLCIEFSDNGRGFSGEDFSALGNLFQRHYSGSGTGVGLYLAKQLVQKMGGTLSFKGGAPGFTAEIRLPGKLL